MAEPVSAAFARQSGRLLRTVIPGILGVTLSSWWWPGSLAKQKPVDWSEVLTLVAFVGTVAGTLVFLLHRNLIHYILNTFMKHLIRRNRAAVQTRGVRVFRFFFLAAWNENEVIQNLRKWESRGSDEGEAARSLADWSADIHAMYVFSLTLALIGALLAWPSQDGWRTLATTPTLLGLAIYVMTLHTDMRETWHEIVLDDLMQKGTLRHRAARVNSNRKILWSLQL